MRNSSLNTKHKIDYDLLHDISNRIFTGQIQQQEAVKELGIPSTTLRHWLKKLGLPAAKDPQLNIWPSKLSKDDIYKAYSELLAGTSYVELRRKYGIDLRQVFERLGFELPVRSKVPPPFRPPLDRNIIAYIAGIFDAEGTIVGPRGLYSLYYINICNTFRPLIDFLLSFGGSIVTVVPKPGEINSKKTQYRWVFSSRKNVLLCLETMLPYLRIKRERSLAVVRHIKLLLEK